MTEQILVVGAILLDSRGKPDAGLAPETSNPAQIRVTRGGTARNVAENLARLGANVRLLSAVGNDMMGHRLISQTAISGVDIELVQIIDGENTGAYIAVLEEDGSLSVALDDVRVLRHITPGYLDRHRSLFKEADMVMMDGSLTPEAMATVVRLCEKYEKPLCADPSSGRLAYKLRPFLSKLYLVVPNEGEAAELCEVGYDGPDPEASLDLARCLVGKGVANVVVTLANFGLDYATTSETGYIPANFSKMVDSSGTGDAVTAAIMFGMLNDLPAIEAIRLGAAAASLTLQTAETVVPDLSLDMLYDHLIV
ncbi:carbohydrate kinase family protein [Candidatus Leptofilum sp.]|uniref:carbohydrate kinase family protein n=1 Tax=Candidatus Leptofilum sp. TaxID=3241576 RepID=UPI003B5BB029